MKTSPEAQKLKRPSADYIPEAREPNRLHSVDSLNDENFMIQLQISSYMTCMEKLKKCLILMYKPEQEAVGT